MSERVRMTFFRPENATDSEWESLYLTIFNSTGEEIYQSDNQCETLVYKLRNEMISSIIKEIFSQKKFTKHFKIKCHVLYEESGETEEVEILI